VFAALKTLLARPSRAEGKGRRVLNVGGGTKAIALPPHFQDWEQLLLDIDPSGGADLVCDARALRETVDANGFDAVYCSHNLEHYYKHDVEKVLQGFLHVLKKEGFAEIRVPDIGALVKLLAKHDLDLEQEIYRSPAGPITAHDMVYGYGPEIEQSGQDFYAHKTGFSADSLVRALRSSGFAEIHFAPPLSALELHVFAFKAKPDAAQRAALRLGEPVATGSQRDAPLAQADPVEALYQRASAAFKESDWPRAAELAGQAATAEPGLAAPHYLRGGALFEMGEFAAAQAAFEACVACKPGYPLLVNAELGAARAWARASLAAGRMPQIVPLDARGRSISVIICSIRQERYARVRANFEERLAGVEHEIIGIHDARSLCEGYNRGMRQARGDVLVFSHDDIELASPDFAARLLFHLDRCDVVGVVGSTRAVAGAWVQAGWPHLHGQVAVPGSAPGRVVVTTFDMHGSATPAAQALDGMLIAANREAALRAGWDDATFDGWHFYDADFSYGAWLSGLRTAVAHDLLVVHDSFGSFGEDWMRYREKFRQKHRATLPQGVPPGQPELCAVEAASHDEWRLMTQYLISASG
jgi:tetratricopeptide (TPR) repeat protein